MTISRAGPTISHGQPLTIPGDVDGAFGFLAVRRCAGRSGRQGLYVPLQGCGGYRGPDCLHQNTQRHADGPMRTGAQQYELEIPRSALPAGFPHRKTEPVDRHPRTDGGFRVQSQDLRLIAYSSGDLNCRLFVAARRSSGMARAKASSRRGPIHARSFSFARRLAFSSITRPCTGSRRTWVPSNTA